MDYTSIKVGQLPTAEISGSDYFPHEVAGLLKKATITDLAAFIGATDAIGFRAVSVPNGGTLPTTDTQEFILVGPGTYNNVGGGSTITVTEELNALVSNGTYWFVGVEIPIDAPPGNAIWGQIIGTLSNQTDLKNILDLKADLVAGKVPSSQLPSYVDDVIEVANYAALPATGETGKIYITIDTEYIYRWSGSAYIRIVDEAAAWGTITGTLSNQTDLQSALNAKVPTSRTITINGTTYDLSANRSWSITEGVWGQITGTLSNQTDLQSALDGKFDDPTGDTTQYIAGDGSLISFPVAGQAGTLVRSVLNNSGSTITKGTVVYINGASGNKPTIAKALATSDSTSAQTFGLVQADISNNANGYVVCIGDLIGVNTSGISVGTQLYLSSTTAGEYTTTKQLAPAHLVYVGVVTRSHATLGQIEVKIQNGYELDELHDVAISSKTNKDLLTYESSSDLWKNKSLGTILGGTSSQFVKGDGSLDSNSYLPLTGGTVTGTLNVDGSGSTTPAITSIFNTGRNRLLTPVLRLYGASDISSKYVELLGENATANRTIQFPDSDGTVALTSQVVTLTGDQTVAGIKTFSSTVNAPIFQLAANNTIGSTPNYIGQQMATNDTWKIYGNTVSSDEGELVFELGDNAMPIGSNGQRFRFFYNNTSDGTAKSPFILDYNDATFNTNATFSGNVGIGTISPSDKLTVSGGSIKNIISNGASSHIQLTNTLGSTYFGNDGNGGYLYTDWNAPFLFYTNSTERMRITSGGNIGIGVNPTEFFEVVKNQNATTRFLVSNSDTTNTSSRASIRTVSGSIIGEMVSINGANLYFGTASNHDLSLMSNGSERMRIATGGNVLIGATSVTENSGLTIKPVNGASFAQLAIVGNNASGSDASLYFEAPGQNGCGMFYQRSTALLKVWSGTTSNGVFLTQFGTSWSSYSDIRLKTDLIPIENALDKIKDIRAVTGRYKTDDENMSRSFLIAQDIVEVFPEAVFKSNDEMETLSLSYTDMVPLLLKAIQELKSEIEILKNK